jgi:hypothetical protein
MAASADYACSVQLRKLHIAFLAAGAAATLAGCGGDSSARGTASKSPAELVATARRIAEEAKSVLVAGLVIRDGTPLRLDFHIVRGRGATGALHLGSIGGFKLINIGKSVYIRGPGPSFSFDQEFEGGKAAAPLKGKWLKAPSDSGQFQAVGSVTDLRHLLGMVLDQHTSFTKGHASYIDGEPVIELKDTSGGSVDVATTGEPYPMQITKAGGSNVIIMDQWNRPIAIKAPSNVIDVEKLRAELRAEG